MHTHQIESVRPSFPSDAAFMIALGTPPIDAGEKSESKATLPDSDLTEQEPEQNGVPYSPLND